MQVHWKYICIKTFVQNHLSQRRKEESDYPITRNPTRRV